MCGGYPAPTCHKHHAVRQPNLAERIAEAAPLPHCTGIDPLRSDMEKLLTGDHATVEGPYITAPHKHDDIFSHACNGGGGFGDVLERDPVKTALDVENRHVTELAARQVFGIAVTWTEDGECRADLKATAQLRRDMRALRLRRAAPVTDWVKGQRERVAAADFAKEVKSMYAAAMKLSDQFRGDFTTFWDLPRDIDLGGKP